MSESKTVDITQWTTGKQIADVTVWKLGAGADDHAELANRARVAIYSGICTVYINPTADEARELIKSLQWALGEAE